MKKIILFVSVFIGLVMQAQTSNLVVFSEELNPFYLFVNGVKQNTAPQTNVKVVNIKTPDIAIMVVFENKVLGTVKDDFYFHDMGVEVTAKIKKTSKGYKLDYFSEVPLNEVTTSSQTYSNRPQDDDVEVPSEEISVSSPVKPTQTEVAPPKNFTPIKNPEPPKTIVNPSNTSNPIGTATGTFQMNYKWIAGKKYTFVTTQTDNVNTSMMGMNMKDQFKGKTKFAMNINSVDAKGTASGTLHLLDYYVIDSKGNVLASIANLPTTAIKSDFKVDTKGNFTFLKKITLVTTAQGNALVYGNATENSISAGGEVGPVKVDVYAEFNPKTGALKTGYTIKENQALNQISIKVDEDTDVIDVLPYDYLDLLELPDGTVKQGDKVAVNTGIYTVTVTAKNISNGVAQLNYKMDADKSKNPVGSSASMQSENSSLTMGMPNMNQIMDEMSGEEKEELALTKQMMPSLTLDFDTFFDYNEGMFSLVKGVMTTTVSTMGLNMEVVSNLEMKKL